VKVKVGIPRQTMSGEHMASFGHPVSSVYFATAGGSMRLTPAPLLLELLQQRNQFARPLLPLAPWRSAFCLGIDFLQQSHDGLIDALSLPARLVESCVSIHHYSFGTAGLWSCSVVVWLRGRKTKSQIA
jgi:hypothetical protein